jgi:hypothetical protein
LPQNRLGDFDGLSKNILDGQMRQPGRFFDFLKQVIRDRKWNRLRHVNILLPLGLNSNVNSREFQVAGRASRSFALIPNTGGAEFRWADGARVRGLLPFQDAEMRKKHLNTLNALASAANVPPLATKSPSL